MRDYYIRITLLEEMLGTGSPDPEIHRNYIASKSPDAATIEQEVEAIGVDAVADSKTTVFPRDENGNPFMWDYQMRGFFKGACSFLRKVPGMESAKIKAYKKEIDGNIFVVFPRKIPMVLSGKMDTCERPPARIDPAGRAGGAGEQRDGARRDDARLYGTPAQRKRPRGCADGMARIWRSQRRGPMAQQWKGPFQLCGAG